MKKDYIYYADILLEYGKNIENGFYLEELIKDVEEKRGLDGQISSLERLIKLHFIEYKYLIIYEDTDPTPDNILLEGYKCLEHGGHILYQKYKKQQNGIIQNQTIINSSGDSNIVNTGDDNQFNLSGEKSCNSIIQIFTTQEKYDKLIKFMNEENIKYKL